MDQTPSNSRLKISIRDQAGDHIYFSVRREAKVMKLLRNYCREKNLDYKTVNFLHNGARLLRRGTAEEVGLKDQDEILAALPTNGGGPSI